MAEALGRPGPKVLVTVHRRESWGAPMERVARPSKRVCAELPEVTFIFPIHLNPVVRKTFREILGAVDQVVFCEPLPYRPFVHLMKAVDVVITDSGGIQEEAPTLGKPVLVMRDTTERPEGIAAGTARLVGTDTDAIARELLALLTDRAAYERMANAVNPYGDGRAAERIADHLEYRFGLRAAPPAAVRCRRPRLASRRGRRPAAAGLEPVYSRRRRAMSAAAAPAPTPLSMFTATRPGEQLCRME